MPSRKILVILIICFGVVGAVWILQTNFGDGAQSAEMAGQNQPEAITPTVTQTLATSTEIDWQNVLGNVDGTTTVASGLEEVDTTGGDDSTMTSQLAKDFMARYVLAQGQANQSGVDTTNGLDQGTTDQIASDVLSSGAYTSTQAVVYTAKNLNVQADSGKTTVLNYYLDLRKATLQAEVDYQKNGNEIDIINSAILNQDQNEIAKLDPIIASYQNLLSAVIKSPTPADAVSLQLEFVNDIGRVLYDLQSIRVSFVDPVKSLAAANAYTQDYTNMGVAVSKIEIYLEAMIKSFKN